MTARNLARMARCVWPQLGVVAVLFLTALRGFAQLTPEQEIATFQMPEGLRIELVAAEPLTASPCAIAFDEHGRLFVAENRGYPRGPGEGARPEGVVGMLEDTDGDGRMDKRTVIADGLTFPNGVMPWRGGLIVTCAPDVLYFPIPKPGASAESGAKPRVLLTGFDTTKSTQLRVNAPTLGPDGWIYFAAGLTGGTITSPEHPEKPALKMTGDLRWNPHTGDFENVDGRSQFGMAFDEFGRRFICMNRLPVQHVVLSSKVLARNPHLAFSETVQDCSERSVKTGLKGGGDGVRLFPISANITTADSHAGSFSAACGIKIWRDGALPLELREAALACDPTANLVHADRLETTDLTFRARPFYSKQELLASADDWFRPVFLASGPDGALYVCDMYRKTIEHPDYLPEEVRKRTDFESGKELGRIWRVWHPKFAVKPAVGLGRDTVADLVRRMDSRCGWEVDTAFRLLIERRAAGAAESLRAAIESPGSSHSQFWRIQTLAALGPVDDEFLERLVRDQDVGTHSAALWLASERGPLSPSLTEAVLARAEKAQPAYDLLPCLLALRECRDPRAVAELAKAILWIPERWTIAAATSSAAGRERELLAEVMKRADASGSRVHGEEIRDLVIEIAALAARACPAKERLGELAKLAHGSTSPTADLLPLMLVAFAEAAAIHPYERVREKALFEWAQQIALGTGSDRSRSMAIRYLAQTPWDDASGSLQRLLISEDQAIKVAAIRALVLFDRDDAVGALLNRQFWANATPAIRETIVSALLARPAQHGRILHALEMGELPASAFNVQRRGILLKQKDAALRERAEKIFGSAVADDRQKAFDRAKVVLSLAVSARHGREIFKTHCAICHRLDREGVTVGPDLLDMRNQPKESVLFHIVVPDAEIAPAFTAYLVDTMDGRSLAGILTSDTTTSITLKLPLAVEESILRANIAKIEAMPGSLMPSGLEAAMSQQDLADLLGFLKGEQ